MRLDPRVIHLWRIGQAISSAILLGILGVAVLIISLNVRGAFKYAIAGWGLILIYRIFMFIWYPPRAYRAWSYRLDGRVLETHSGVFFQVIQLLPLSRLQHVDLHRGPIERYFGLASLALHTAGTVQSALVIPGLAFEEGSRLRDELVAIGGDDAV
jgi:hypothetical protein